MRLDYLINRIRQDSRAVRDLGYRVRVDEEDRRVVIVPPQGVQRVILGPSADLFISNSRWMWSTTAADTSLEDARLAELKHYLEA